MKALGKQRTLTGLMCCELRMRTMLFYPMNNRWRGEGFRLILVTLALLCSRRCEAQGNLVPNPSFELQDTCPYTVGFQEGDRPLHWFSWYNSPEYFNACAGTLQSIDTLVDVPQNAWTYQYAWEGNAYVGMYAYDGVSDEYREYVGAELLEPLVVGCDYRIRFRANPAFDGNYALPDGGGACNNIGLLFTTGSNAWNGVTGPAFGFRNDAHVFTSSVIDDTLAWTLVEGIFTADSSYGYVVLGNFFTDALTIGYPNAGSWTDISYYLIDSVSVTPVDATCHGVGLPEEPLIDMPKLSWSEQGVAISWKRERFAACITDVTGRRLGPDVISGGGEVLVTLPSTAGAYVLRLKCGEQTFVVKFVLT